MRSARSRGNMTYSSTSENVTLATRVPMHKRTIPDEGNVGKTGSRGEKEGEKEGSELGLRGQCETFLSLRAGLHLFYNSHQWGSLAIQRCPSYREQLFGGVAHFRH